MVAIKTQIDVEADNLADATIEGTRISVFQIVESHYYLEQSLDYIADAFNLSLAQIHTALAFYHEHKESFDQAVLDYYKENDPEFVPQVIKRMQQFGHRL